MVVGTPRPQITSITGAGTGNVTVNYANTVAGKTYTLQYNTNLNTRNCNPQAPSKPRAQRIPRPKALSPLANATIGSIHRKAAFAAGLANPTPFDEPGATGWPKRYPAGNVAGLRDEAGH